MKMIKVKPLIIILIFLLLLFENTILSNSFIVYVDEIYALLFIPLLVMNLKNIEFRKTDLLALLFFVLFISAGILGNLIYKYQNSFSIIIDIITNIKFILGILSTIFLIKDKNELESIGNTLSIFLKIFIAVNVFLGLLTYLNIYNDGFMGYRYGIKALKLYFNHSTYYAAANFVSSVLIYLFMKKKSDYIFIILGFILTILSLRAKAFISVVTAVSCFYIFRKRLLFGNIKYLFFLLGLVIITIIGYDAYDTYFNNDYNARQALTETCFKIAKDYFPVGGGFATFGSSESVKNYSMLYSIYGIDKVYGLSPDFSNFISDTFWPMIIGQTGAIGIISYIIILFTIFKKFILYAFKKNRSCFICSLVCFLYLLISSLAESSFVNSISLLFAFIIGIAYLKAKYEVCDGV